MCGLDPARLTLRELWWAAEARMEFGGDLVAALARLIPAAVWAPAELAKLADLNPYRAGKPESAAMRKHRESWARRKFRVLSGG